jgi:hypothetical protein
MPENTVKVTRPGKWGNPFIVNTHVKPGSRSGCEYICVPTLEDAVECFREMMLQHQEWIEDAKRELGGKNLACWCPLPKNGEPDVCHAAVLLELARGTIMYATDSSKVIVRAYGDQPRLMFLKFDEDGKSVVYESSAENSIPYPMAFVYEADDKLFALLDAAYRAADDVQLRTLWTKARRFTHKETA